MAGEKQIEAVEEFAKRHVNTLGEFLEYRTFALSQGVSLDFEAVSAEIKKGVCWAMSYDWARFQVYDYNVQQRRFAIIRQKTIRLQERLNQTRLTSQMLLDEFAANEGFSRRLIEEGSKPALGRPGFSPEQIAITEILSAIDTDPKLDPAGVRMLGFDSQDGGHEIALRIKEPFRVFDPNYGQFDAPSLKVLKSILTRILNTTYVRLMNSWDLYSVERAFPRAQGVVGGTIEIPDYVAGAPAAAWEPVTVELSEEQKAEIAAAADAKAEDIMASIFADLSEGY